MKVERMDSIQFMHTPSGANQPISYGYASPVFAEVGRERIGSHRNFRRRASSYDIYRAPLTSDPLGRLMRVYLTRRVAIKLPYKIGYFNVS